MCNNINKVIVLLFLNLFLQLSHAGVDQLKGIANDWLKLIEVYQLRNTVNAMRLHNDINPGLDDLAPIALGVYRVSSQHYEINALLKNVGKETVFLSDEPSEYIFELTDDQGVLHNIVLKNVNTECSSSILAGEECTVTITAVVELNDANYVAYAISLPYQVANSGGFRESTVVDAMSEIKISRFLQKSTRTFGEYKLKIEAITETIPEIIDIYLDKNLDEYIEPFKISFAEDMECCNRFCKIRFKLKDDLPQKDTKGYMFVVYKVAGEEQLKKLLIPIEIACRLDPLYRVLGTISVIGSASFILQKCCAKLRDFLPYFSRHHHSQDIQEIGYPGHRYGHQCRFCIVRRNNWLEKNPGVPYHSDKDSVVIYDHSFQGLFAVVPDGQQAIFMNKLEELYFPDSDFSVDVLTLNEQNRTLVNPDTTTEDYFPRFFLYNSTVLVQ